MQPGSGRHKITLTTPRSKRNASTSPMSQMLIGLPIDRLQASTTRSRCAISTVVSVVMSVGALDVLPYSAGMIVMTPSDRNFRAGKKQSFVLVWTNRAPMSTKVRFAAAQAFDRHRVAAHDECSVGTLDLSGCSPVESIKQMIVWRYACPVGCGTTL